jgi:hypothetical protein
MANTRRVERAAALDAVERLMSRDVGRGSAELAELTAGSLAAAAASLIDATAPHVVILTGFFIPGADPPAAETDGPVGSAQLAVALLSLGATVRLLTDEPCAAAVGAAARSAGADVPVDVAPLPSSAGRAAYDAWESALLGGYRGSAPVTHMISVERVGPSPSGVPRNMRGDDLERWTAPLHRPFMAGPWVGIGIGDGGNEIGMGALPADAVARVVDRGELIRCTVDCEFLLVGGTSNWAAAGLTAALALLAPAPRRPPLERLLAPEWSRHLLRELDESRLAVDGVTRRPGRTVDGLPAGDYEQILREILDVVQDAGAATAAEPGPE